MMAKHMREVIGVTPRAVRRQVRPWEFVDTLATWLCPRPEPAIVLAPRQPARFAGAATAWDRPVHVRADMAPAPDAARITPGFDASWPDHPSGPRLA